MHGKTIPALVIFDLDGVLVSTDKYHRMGWQRLADEMGIPFDSEQAERTRGVDRMASLKIVLGASASYSEEEMVALAARKNGYYLELIKQIDPGDLLPGAMDLLAELESHGVRKAVGSASKNAREVVDRLGIARRFETIVTGNDFTNGKPAPDVFLTAAHRLGVPSEDCVVFEDAAAGIQAAHAGGMKAVGIGRGDTVAGADWIVDSLVGIRHDDLTRLFPSQGERL